MHVKSSEDYKIFNNIIHFNLFSVHSMLILSVLTVISIFILTVFLYLLPIRNISIFIVCVKAIFYLCSPGLEDLHETIYDTYI